MKCFITREDVSARDLYYFGSPDRLILPLTQRAFAHFILSAEKDEVHNSILQGIETASHEYEMLTQKMFTQTKYSIDWAEQSLQVGKFATELAQLLDKKAASGFRILSKLRREFKKHGRLGDLGKYGPA